VTNEDENAIGGEKAFLASQEVLRANRFGLFVANYLGQDGVPEQISFSDVRGRVL